MNNQNGTETEVVVTAEPITTEALTVYEDATPSVFSNKTNFEHAQRVSKMLAESELVPATFQKKIHNCMIALEMANRMGASPLMVMQNLYIVHGKPAWSSQFLIATLNASGRFSSLRYEESEKDGGSTRAYAKDLKTGEVCYGTWVSMQMATAEGWSTKTGSKWKTMPELMRRYRAATFFTRQFAPEVSMGFATVEEAHDVTPATAPNPEVKKEQTHAERLLALIAAATTPEELNKHRKHLGDNKEALEAFMAKETELEAAK